MLKRTPPDSPCQHASGSNYASRSDIQTADNSNITQRKRKQEDENKCSIENIMIEMKSMFNSLVNQQTEQNKKIDSLQTALDEIWSQNTIIKSQNSEIRTQNSDLQKSIEFLSHKYDDAVKKIENLQAECKGSKEVIKVLENRLDYLERQARVASLELKNIPLSTPENKATLIGIVEKIGHIVNNPVTGNEVKEIFRIKTKNTDSPGSVIVDFVSSSIKERFFKSIKTYNKENKHNRLNTSLLQNSGPKTSIYVSEALTAKSKRLHYLAREFIKNSDFEHCWTSNGKIYVRKREGLPSRLISSEEDLVNLRRDK